VLDRHTWRSGEPFARLATFGFETIDILNQVVLNQPQNVLQFSVVEELIDRLSEFDMVPFGLSPTSVKSLLRPMTHKFFRRLEGSAATNAVFDGMSLVELENARAEYMLWVQTQLGIFEYLNLPRPPGLEKIPASFTSQFRTLLNSNRRLLLDERNRLQMPGAQKNSAWDLFSLTQLNWRHQFIRLVVRGYAQLPARVSRMIGVSRDEFRVFHDDFRFVGRELNILDPRDPGLWKTIFSEANIFTWSADGDEILSFNEGVDLITFAQSVSGTNRPAWNRAIEMVSHSSSRGIDCERQLHGAMNPNCRQWNRTEGRSGLESLMGPVDVFRINMIDAHYFREFFRIHFDTIYENLPGMVHYFSSISRGLQAEFIRYLEDAGRCTGRSNRKYESADMDKITMIFHYIEGVFVRFDANQDGVLVTEDIERLFPLVQPQLKDLMPEGLTERTQFIIFSYLVSTGQEPGKLDVAYWEAWDRVFGTKLQVNRGQLLRTLALVRNKQPRKRVVVGGTEHDPTRFCGNPQTEWPVPVFPIDTED
jgi:hypothetical protein